MDRMTSLERTMTAIHNQEPDRVPLFLLLSLYGARELGLTVKEYFAESENVVEAQLKMRAKYGNDCIYTLFYLAAEIEAFGGEVLFYDEGPPNSGEPVLKSPDEILKLKVPPIGDSAVLRRILETTRSLKKRTGREVPVIGVVLSPFSLPLMQIGFEKYLELLYFEKDYFGRLMEINKRFCISWANAQLEAGADAICYFNPLASPSMIEREKYLETGYVIDKETMGKIKGLVAVHLASGMVLPVLDEIIGTGSKIVGFSTSDDLETIKKKARDRICLMGNLNGVEMANWDSKKTIGEVKKIIAKAGGGGGLILSDNHGEIPWQVAQDTLLDISETVRSFGRYPLEWI